MTVYQNWEKGANLANNIKDQSSKQLTFLLKLKLRAEVVKLIQWNMEQ